MNEIETYKHTVLSVIVRGRTWNGDAATYEYITHEVPANHEEVKRLAADFRTINSYTVLRCETVSTYEVIKEENFEEAERS